MVQDRCDGVDLHLGCPQGIARTGHYGSFLLEEPELLERIVAHLHENLSVPVTAKIRILPSLEDTISLAKRLESAGISMLAVHGRLKEQNKQYVGSCDWNAVKAIKEALKIPVILNGGIQSIDDVNRCMKETSVDGVMSSEAILENPALFTGNVDPDSGEYVDQNRLALEYLAMCDKYGTEGMGSGLKCVRAHMFKFLMYGLKTNQDLCQRMASSKSLEEIRGVVKDLAERGWPQPYHHGGSHPTLGKEHAPEYSWYSRYQTHNKDGMGPASKKLEAAELKRARSLESDVGPPTKVAKQSVPKPATCSVCKESFPSRSKMFKHIKSAHPESMKGAA